MVFSTGSYGSGDVLVPGLLFGSENVEVLLGFISSFEPAKLTLLTRHTV